MTWIFIITLLLLLGGGVAEKSNHDAAVKLRGTRVYQGGRRRIVDLASNVRGHTTVYVNGKRTTIDGLPGVAAAAVRPQAAAKPKKRAAPIAYEPPPAAAAPPAAGGGPGGGASTSSGITVDFFQGLLMLVNAPYEGPNDALRQLRSLGEGGRQWDSGLIRLHQRMSDSGDMRIDPFVSDHVIRAAAFGQAMVLELVEADSALTALLNMTLAEITQRGLQVPNTR